MRSIFSLYSYELQPLLVWSADRLNIYYSIKSKLRSEAFIYYPYWYGRMKSV